MNELSEQNANYKSGTSSLFTGLMFLTLVPWLFNYFLIYKDPLIYKIIAVVFMGKTIYLYHKSPAYLNRQFFWIGITFILFAILQFFLGSDLKLTFGIIFCMVFGTVLSIYFAFHFKKLAN